MVDEKTEVCFLVFFLMKISNRHLYHLHIERPGKVKGNLFFYKGTGCKACFYLTMNWLLP